MLPSQCQSEQAAPDDLTIRFVNNLLGLEHAMDELENFLVISHPQHAQIARLVLEEMASNTIKYGYDDNDPHVLLVRFRACPPAQLIIEDDGCPFNPLLDAPEAAIDAELEDRPIGGLGIHMVKTMTAAQSYRRSNGLNHFSVTFIERSPIT
jgi:anti-sigma regulatory factor (Ser/Thr protein kinase)